MSTQPMSEGARRAGEEIAAEIKNMLACYSDGAIHDCDCAKLCLLTELDMSGHIAAIFDRHMREDNSGVGLIARERRRQIEKEGFDAAHDSNHVDDALAWGAMFYALPNPFLLCSALKPKTVLGVVKAEAFFEKTQWANIWAKRNGKTRIQQLVVAGALIAAEIDRLKRKEGEGCKGK